MKTIEDRQKRIADTVDALSSEMLKAGIISLHLRGKIDIVGRIRIVDGGIVFCDTKLEQLNIVDIDKSKKSENDGNASQ